MWTCCKQARGSASCVTRVISGGTHCTVCNLRGADNGARGVGPPGFCKVLCGNPACMSTANPPCTLIPGAVHNWVKIPDA